MMKLVKPLAALDSDAIIRDIQRRHSTLHQVDKHCAKAMQALGEMVLVAGEHGLTAELDAVHRALCVLHAAAKSKFEALP